jgi:hypothetical protein
MHNITPSSISSSFGYKSDIAGKIISELCSILESEKNFSEMESIFTDWKIFFQEVSGFKETKLAKDINELINSYSFSTSLDPYKVLFVFHTYYSLIVRWLTLQIISKKEDSNESQHHLFDPDIIQEYFLKKGVRNFGKTRYFDWYQGYSTDTLKKYFEELNQTASKFIMIPNEEEKKITQDLLVLLYQNLFPPKIRHHLGEYYTPKWVTDLSIKNSGYDFDPEKKVLDPSCGSGTFLLSVIDGVLDRNRNSDNKVIEKILTNIIGFDLNPLAVLSAKANYILALKEFLPLPKEYDIPIYHYDSVLCEGIIKNEKSESIMGNDSDANESGTMYEHIPESILRISQFDFIFGNPPWINWKHVPDYYKKSVLPAAERYNLFQHKGLKARLGFAQDDVCVILIYSVLDFFLKRNGILSFVLPVTLFKTVGGGDGFRQFKIGDTGDPIKVLSVIDLSGIKVFDSCSSKSAIFTCKKGEETVYPVAYDIYSKKTIKSANGIISQNNSRESFHITSQLAEPIGSLNSNWITADGHILDLIKRIISPSDYTARAGVCTWSSSIYWVTIEKQIDNFITIKPYNKTAKIKNNFETADIEQNLVFPLVRGRDITRWHSDPKLFIILPQSLDNPAKAIPEYILKESHPKAYKYFLKHKLFLKNRKGYIKFLSNEPFYSIFDIGPYTFSKYKVAWKYLDTDLRAVVLDSSEIDKPIIPDLNVVIIPANSPDEAHYIAASLNSSVTKLLIQAFGLCTRITPGILKHLPIKKYDPNNSIHKDLSGLSKRCHEAYSDAESINNINRDIDKLIQNLLKIEDIDFSKITNNFLLKDG